MPNKRKQKQPKKANKKLPNPYARFGAQVDLEMAHIRLLDIMLILAQYRSNDRILLSTEERDRCAELYQDVGNLPEPMTEESIRAFIINSFIPFILDGA
jgi:hypothetical protein